MANYGTLKAAIDAYIKRNGQQRITGDLLNAVLNAAVDALGMGYQFLGIATAETDPGTPDARVFYLAGAGTYPNFGSTEIPEGSIGIFCYGSAWDYLVLQVGSGGGGSEDAVLYTPQTLTTEQKSQARSNIGAGIGNYSKPGTGIPKTDLAEGVQTSLGKADTAYQKPGTGIPATDMAEGVIPTDVVKYVAQTLTTAQKSQARSNIGAGTYTKSSNGIPKSDLASGVQTSLGKADTAYQKPSGGIPSTDLASAVQTSLGKADSAYQKPGTGIPATDIASGVIPTSVVQYSSQSLTDEQKTQARTNIGAGTYSKPSGGIPATDLASAVQTSLGKADTAYQKAGTGIPSSDMASAVQTSLGKADTAVQPADISNLISLADLERYAETWTFTLEDDTTITKKIIVLPTT